MECKRLSVSTQCEFFAPLIYSFALQLFHSFCSTNSVPVCACEIVLRGYDMYWCSFFQDVHQVSLMCLIKCAMTCIKTNAITITLETEMNVENEARETHSVSVCLHHMFVCRMSFIPIFSIHTASCDLDHNIIYQTMCCIYTILLCGKDNLRVELAMSLMMLKTR